MLNFLVLGIVPGTAFILTLKWIIGIATVLTGVGLLISRQNPTMALPALPSQASETPSISAQS